MDKMKSHNKCRIIIQAISFAFSNGYVNGWVHGKIYTGDYKKICLPGLNCYSCPGAIFACPIGSLQAVLGAKGYRFSLYVLGYIGLIGMFFGRAVCGWVCPFGFIQDLLYKIPIFRKIKNLPGHRYLKYLKYVVLAIFVIILPAVVRGSSGTGVPWFCEYICPDGTLLGGIPLSIANADVRAAIGWRFCLKLAILAVIVVSGIKSYRPFCKYLCPLGALYSLANPISFYRYSVDREKCISCGLCREVCDMDIKVYEQPNSPECIRCGKCKRACPKGAIESSIDILKKKYVEDEL